MMQGEDYIQIGRLEAGVGCCKSNFETRLQGCQCSNGCNVSTHCSCLLYNQDVFTNQNSLKDIEIEVPILECSSECECSNNLTGCENRCVQFGPSLPLHVFETSSKGYGLHCSIAIEKCQFVIEYVGEVIGPTEVIRRQRPENNFVLTVCENFQSGTETTYIDPSRRGNLARFINHSCDPNLKLIIVRIGTLQIHVGLFAKRKIPAFEELCYDYGASASVHTDSAKRCHCASANCRQFLPISDSPVSL